MTETPGRRPENTTGRRRDEERTDAILKAAGDLLLEVGFDRFRTQDIAERAGAGKGAIYRRWPTKEALLAEAIRRMPAGEAPHTDDPVADLRAIVEDRCHSAETKPDLVPGLITAMRADEGIEAAVKDGYDLSYMRDTIARIIGSEHPHLELLADMTQAVPLLRAAFTPESLDGQQMADQIVSLIASLADPNGVAHGAG
ncbi:MAG: helix-turn-helix domain-containing protein [Actinomycetota bacterium]